MKGQQVNFRYLSSKQANSLEEFTRLFSDR